MKANIHDLGYEPTDQSDDMLDRAITDVLKTLRDRMNMDVVFCSEFVDGRRVFRQVATSGVRQTVSVGDSDELEQSWCQRVVDGRLPRFMADARADPVASALMDQLPFSIGTHISTPIVLKNGEVYGTLCSFSFSPQDNPNPEDLKTLEMTAKLTAMRLDGRNVMPAPRDIPDWNLKPK
jgi:GAF domain-containing protein